MDARQEAIGFYKGSSRTISQGMAYHANNPGGVVIWTHRLVVMARPVSTKDDAACIIEPKFKTRGLPDAWHIHIMAGDIPALLPHIHELKKYPSIVFQRGARCNRLHVMRTERFVKSRPMSML